MIVLSEQNMKELHLTFFQLIVQGTINFLPASVRG